MGSRRVEHSDKERLPYIMAVIEETLRYTSIAPFLVNHVTLVDTKLLGYNVPKGDGC